MLYNPINKQFSYQMIADEFVKYIFHHSNLSRDEVYMAGRMLARANNPQEMMIVIMSVNAEKNPNKKK